MTYANSFWIATFGLIYDIVIYVQSLMFGMLIVIEVC